MATLMNVGQPVPTFSLIDIEGKTHSLADVHGTILVLVFWSAECPWSERADELIQSWRVDWGNRVVVWIGGCPRRYEWSNRRSIWSGDNSTLLRDR
jgi:hypothetical protein